MLTVDYGNGLTKKFSEETIALLGNPTPDALRELTRQWAEDSGNYKLERVQHGESIKDQTRALYRYCNKDVHKWHTGRKYRACLTCETLEQRTKDGTSTKWVRVR
jgi:hypothetical protein